MKAHVGLVNFSLDCCAPTNEWSPDKRNATAFFSSRLWCRLLRPFIHASQRQQVQAEQLLFEAQVNARGIVTSVHPVGRTTVLAKAAENSAKRWLFGPTDESNNTRVVRLTFLFKIMPHDTPATNCPPIFHATLRIEVRATVPKDRQY